VVELSAPGAGTAGEGGGSGARGEGRGWWVLGVEVRPARIGGKEGGGEDHLVRRARPGTFFAQTHPPPTGWGDIYSLSDAKSGWKDGLIA